LSNTFRLDLLGVEAACIAIQEPARSAGVEFTDGAAKQLADNLRRVQVLRPDGRMEEQHGLYIEPVQLQVVCRRLWARRNGTPIIDESDIAGLGDIDQSLAEYYAEQVAATAAQTGIAERAIRDWFEHDLITEQRIRSQVLKGQGLPLPAVTALEDAHLVRSESRRGAIWCELAHDRLVQPVLSNNAQWRSANLSLLERQAALWEAEGRPGGLLLSGQSLADAEVWAKAHSAAMASVERDFLAASLTARQAMLRERRRNRMIQALALAASIGAGVALYFYSESVKESDRALMGEFQAVIAANRAHLAEEAAKTAAVTAKQAKEAAQKSEGVAKMERAAEEQQAKRAAARQLAAQAINEANQHRLDLALLLGLEAVNVEDSYETRGGLLTALSENPRVSLFLPSAAGSATKLAFSPDGKTLATATPSQIRFWDPVTGAERGPPLAGPDDAIFCIAFSPDGRLLASSSRGDNALLLWDLTTRQRFGLVKGSNAVSGVAFSPDGKLLVTGGGDRFLSVFDVGSRKLFKQLKGPQSFVQAVAFKPNDNETVASVDQGGNVLLFNVTSGGFFAFPKVHGGQANALAFSKDGQTLVTGGGDGVVFWDVPGHRALTAALKSGDVETIAFSDQGLVASGSFDGGVRLWDSVKREPVGPVLRSTSTGYVSSVAFGPDGRTLASSASDSRVALWNVAQPQRLGHRFNAHPVTITALRFSPDSKMLATSGCAVAPTSYRECTDNEIKVWNVDGMEPRLNRAMKTSGDAVEMMFSAGGGVLVSAHRRQADGSGLDIRFWDVQSGTAATKPFQTDTNGRLEGVAFSPDGETVAVGSRELKIWNVRSAHAAPPLAPALDNFTLDVAFTKDAKLLGATTQSKLNVWNIATGRAIYPPIPARRIAFSPDGKTFATVAQEGAMDKAVEIREVATGGVIGAQLTAIDWLVGSLDFSPDGRLLAVGTLERGLDEARLTLWDVGARQQLGPSLAAHDKSVAPLAFSPDGRLLAKAGDNGAVILWDITLDSWKRRACRTANRSLTYDEWQKYLPNEQYRPTCPGVPADTASMVDAAKNAAADGNIAGAAKILREASKLEPHLRVGVDVEPKKVAAQRLVERGQFTAKAGDYEGAVRLFQNAMQLDPRLKLKPAAEAGKLAAPTRVALGEQLATQGKITEAMAAFAQAQKFDTALKIEAQSWDTVCWSGILFGRAAQVTTFCDHAVTVPTYGRTEILKLHRAIARALTGHTAGAIDDLKSSVDAANKALTVMYHGHPVNDQRSLEQFISRDKQWIDSLSAGKNPFTQEVIRQLDAEAKRPAPPR
jgi:WD40 repeat protein